MSDRAADEAVPTRPDGGGRSDVTYTWIDEPDRSIDAATTVATGRLHLRGRGTGSMHGFTPHEQIERDVVVDAVADFTGLAPDEGFGIFVRRNAPDRYIGARITPGGMIAIGAFDGTETPLAIGPLADGMVLHPTRNLVGVAAVGPSITLSLNGMVVTSVLVDERYASGYTGLLVEQRHERAADVAVDWFRVRAVW